MCHRVTSSQIGLKGSHGNAKWGSLADRYTRFKSSDILRVYVAKKFPNPGVLRLA